MPDDLKTNKDPSRIADLGVVVFERNVLTKTDTTYVFSEIKNDYEHDKPMLYLYETKID